MIKFMGQYGRPSLATAGLLVLKADQLSSCTLSTTSVVPESYLIASTPVTILLTSSWGVTHDTAAAHWQACGEYAPAWHHWAGCVTVLFECGDGAKTGRHHAILCWLSQGEWFSRFNDIDSQT